MNIANRPNKIGMHAYLIYIKMLLAKIQNATKLTDCKKISVKVVHCPICGPTFLIKLNDTEIAIRCIRCGASIITMSLVKILKDLVPDIHTKSFFELSSRGPLFTFLKNNTKSFTYSEYFEDVAPGEFKNGVQCQDVQALTFSNDRFDVCTSTEVFKHVANDRGGFSEIYRVLKRGGLFQGYRINKR
jgi:SAM-dependent methyltransferase